MSSTQTASQFLQKLKNLDSKDLLDIHGIGDKLVQNLATFTSSSQFDKLISKFQELEKNDKGLTIISKVKNQTIGKLTGQTICITGTFDTPRSKIKDELENFGAKVVDNITKQTTILLAGVDAGSKLIKAKKMGVQITESIQEIIN